jgi:hypothetical protein
MPPDRSGPSPPWVMPWNAEGLSNESVRRSVELASMAFREATDGSDPWRRRRRAILLLSLVGMAGLAVAALFQAGLPRRLLSDPSPHPSPGRSS